MKLEASKTDLFYSYMIYDVDLEIPSIRPDNKLPDRFISFQMLLVLMISINGLDSKIERIWSNPGKYISQLKKFRGIITPDFSLYRDMPLVMQQWNTYRGKALGHWWQSNGMNVLPNVRFADERSYRFCCNGVPKHSVICVGSHGCLRRREDRLLFRNGLEAVIAELQPSCIVVYGAAPDDVFACCKEAGIQILQFDSDFARSRKKAVA